MSTSADDLRDTCQPQPQPKRINMNSVTPSNCDSCHQPHLNSNSVIASLSSPMMLHVTHADPTTKQHVTPNIAHL
jgi:hypothetical protein